MITPPVVMPNKPLSAPVPASVKVSELPSASVAAAVPTALCSSAIFVNAEVVNTGLLSFTLVTDIVIVCVSDNAPSLAVTSIT